MKLLLDTHAFLWWVADDPQLSPTAKNMIANSDNTPIVTVDRLIAQYPVRIIW